VPPHLFSAMGIYIGIHWNDNNLIRSALLAECAYEIVDSIRLLFLKPTKKK